MCGIVGCTDSFPELAQARDSMRHRGPDDSGLSMGSEHPVGLAQRRLAIIDCSPTGHQPMVDQRQEMTIVFNGEIYNFLELKRELQGLGHQFRSRSDTEVLLAAYRQWGEECPKRLNGMFAFCIYDTPRKKLFLARDRAGEKPLFYCHANGRLVFASEIKALLQLPGIAPKINYDALEFYLAYGYVPGAMCMLQGLQKLPQGHAMTYDLQSDQLRVWRYWQLPENRPEQGVSDEQLVDQLEELLEDSVRRQLMADVPVGVLLSGGVDSSLVTAMAARVSSRPVKTFNVSFPGHGSYDESPFARLVASHFGAEHIELVGEMASVDLLPSLAAQFDEPLADDSMIPTHLVSKLIREHATVALGGDGGDELFGGYFQHSWIQQLERNRRFFPQFMLDLARYSSEYLIPTGTRGRNYLLAFLQDVPGGISQFNIYFDAATRRKLLTSDHRPAEPERFKAELASRFPSTLQKSTGVDFMTYLVDDILVKVDRSSMLASLEVRAPWLDHRLIDFAFSQVPDRLKATASQRKILPRMLGERLLPKSLDLRRKQGFSVPLDSWFKRGWGDFVQDILRSADSRLFSKQAIQELLDGQQKGRNNTRRLFSLTIFELWRRHYNVGI